MTGGGAPGGYKLLRECGDIHSISLKLLISDFLPSCDTDLVIYEVVLTHESDIILDPMSHFHMLSWIRATAHLICGHMTVSVGERVLM